MEIILIWPPDSSVLEGVISLTKERIDLSKIDVPRDDDRIVQNLSAGARAKEEDVAIIPEIPPVRVGCFIVVRDL